MPILRIALAQINPTVGDLASNTRKIIARIKEARQFGAQLLVFGELALCGYPPEDLLLKPAFIEACRKHLEEIAQNLPQDLAVILGFPEKKGDKLYNAAAVLCGRRISAAYRKHNLPNYGVFDEQRYFTPGREDFVFVLEGFRFAVNICEDIWIEDGVHEEQAAGGRCRLFVNLSASPYHRGKQKERENLLSRRAGKYKTAVAYVNLAGGQDELVFDGGSVLFDPAGKILARGKQFEEDLIVADLASPLSEPQNAINLREILLSSTGSALPQPPLKPHLFQLMDDLEEIYQALALGTRDYLQKNGFGKAVIGISGGIDSSLTACIAADAIGAGQVTGVSFPGAYSSSHSLTDAKVLAGKLGIHHLTIPITPVYEAFLKTLAPVFQDAQIGITEENLQSRIRGTLLMALSNKFGWLVLTTGNKSEVGVGYATLYGDSAGGFAVIKDIPKTLVYELARHRNRKSPCIPENVFIKPPSAELRPNQKDTDSIPEYAILDPILNAYIEHNASLPEITSRGFSPAVVKQVIHLVDHAEYKRRQAPPGVKITPRALGKDWRLPLTNHFTG